MLDEDEREGPEWAWRVTEHLDQNLAPLLIAAGIVAVAVAIATVAGQYGVGMCDPSIIPIAARGQVASAGLVGTFGLGVGLGALFGSC